MASALRKNFIVILVGLNLVLLPVLFIANRARFFHGLLQTRPDALPVYGQTPSFELMREDGSAFGSGQMQGKIWLADFIFTRCQNQCPLMSVKFHALQTVLSPEVRLASFSVDPEFDTPEVLRAYAGTHNAMPDKWVFLTGNKIELWNIMRALHLSSEDDPAMHSLRFVLLDKALRIRGYYDSTETESLVKMRADIEELRTEK